MASTVIGKLTTILTVNTGPFSKGMASAKKSTASFIKGIASAGKKLAKFAAVGVALATAAIIALTIKSPAAVDAVAKLSKTLQMSIDDLRRLRLIATEAGASAQTLDKAILRMSRNIGEAALGYSEATDALDTLGLSALKLEKLDTIEQFRQIADAISRLPNAQRQASIASDLFGRSGQKLVLVLRQGSDGINEMIRVSRTLRGSLNGDDQARVDAEILMRRWVTRARRA